jgi:hypothetical protein
MISESHREYVPLPLEERSGGRTRDDLMATSFVLGDGSAMETKSTLASQKAVGMSDRIDPSLAQERRANLVGSHMNFSQGVPDNWTTTHRTDFANTGGAPAVPIQSRVQDGAGARDSFARPAVLDPCESESRSRYVDFGRQVERADLAERRAAFGKSTLVIGDLGHTTYETTNQAAFARRGREVLSANAADAAAVQARRARLQKSRVNEGCHEPTFQKSSYGDSFVEHKGFRPEKAEERSAFISHLPSGNSTDDQVYQTCSREAYQPTVGDRVDIRDIGLRDSHLAIGSDAINERNSLYRETYKGEQLRQDRVDPVAVRDFHTSHHCKMGSWWRNEPTQSEAKSAYIHHRGARPRSPCHLIQGGSVICPADPSMTIRESAMKRDYVEHKKVDRNPPVNNRLQQSHILATSGFEDKWTTTSQDYFRFKTFNTHA